MFDLKFLLYSEVYSLIPRLSTCMHVKSMTFEHVIRDKSRWSAEIFIAIPAYIFLYCAICRVAVAIYPSCPEPTVCHNTIMSLAAPFTSRLWIFLCAVSSCNSRELHLCWSKDIADSWADCLAANCVFRVKISCSFKATTSSLP